MISPAGIPRCVSIKGPGVRASVGALVCVCVHRIIINMQKQINVRLRQFRTVCVACFHVSGGWSLAWNVFARADEAAGSELNADIGSCQRRDDGDLRAPLPLLLSLQTPFHCSGRIRHHLHLLICLFAVVNTQTSQTEEEKHSVICPLPPHLPRFRQCNDVCRGVWAQWQRKNQAVHGNNTFSSKPLQSWHRLDTQKGEK